MPTLGTPSATIEILQKHQFHFQKKYGQNFLVEPGILQSIVDAAGITETDAVLEIGPGIGTLTQYLAERAGAVIAVEIDKALIPILGDTLSAYPNVTVINEDILKVDIVRLAEEYNGGKPFKVDIRELADRYNGGRPIKVVANLPYYITTPIIMKLFESHAPLDSITVMVQTEVAERMRTGPGSKDYGALSLAVQYYSKPKIVTHVPPSCFIPRPKVGSTVISLLRYEQPPVRTADEGFLFALIRASFNMRRKTLVNGLSGAADLHVTKEEAAAALEKMGLPANVRGETLTLEQFAQLGTLLYKEKREK